MIVASAAAMTGPGDLRDQHWLDERITAIEDGIEAVLDIAREWTDGRNLSRLHPGTSAQDYILARVKHPLGRGVVVPLLAESNWSNRQIAAVAGVSHQTVARLATGPVGPVDRPAETLGADGRLRPGRVVREVVATVIEPVDEPVVDSSATSIPINPRIILRDFQRFVDGLTVEALGSSAWEAITAIEASFAGLRFARDDHAAHAGMEELVYGCAECDVEGDAFEAEREAQYQAELKAERKAERERVKRRAAWILANPDVIAWRCDGCEAEFTDEDADQGQGALYECSDCGMRFTRDGSADGSGNRCSDCNRFGSKVADMACPDCGEDGLEPVGIEAEL